ncbi:phage tail protein [Stenotrophomonas maltophilia]|uniref:phage tail protein n=1 Tax=Stenotrophomonas maltophilia TaxID=40324 RepID=UPI0013DCEC44|nr:phage tail protein [Stenotrophomonas maltophilia]
MKKPQLLRQHLVAAIPALAADPDKLMIFVDNGGLAGTYRPGMAFEYRYTLDLVLTDFGGAPEAVMVPLLQWLTRHQPELLANPANREKLTFEVDVLGDNLVDLAIKMPLTERVMVTTDGEGSVHLAHLPEPPTEAEHADALAGGMLMADGVQIGMLPAIVG